MSQAHREPRSRTRHKRPSSFTADDEQLRAKEIDEAIGTVLVATTVALAVLGAIEIPRLGVAFAAWMSLPSICVFARRAAIDRGAHPTPWSALLLASTFVGCIAASTITGGVGSPGSFFFGLVPLLGLILFPSRLWVLGVGLAGVAGVVAIDRMLDRPFDAFVVSSALVLAAATPAAVSRLLLLEEMHRRRSVIDPLTGCLNRRALESRSAELEEQARRLPSTVAVITFDLDHFKRINDRHGHALGDRVLSHVADVVRRNLRTFDLLFRIGGEEFVILLPGAELSAGIDLASRLRATIADEHVEGVVVTSSFGVAFASSPFSVSDVIASADRELYRAKASGRDCVVAAGIAGSFGAITG